MINGENFFDQPIKNKKITYDNIRKIATGYGNDYTTGCLLDYPYFIETYKMIAVDLSKQKALDFDSKAIQQIKFTAHLDRAGNTRVYFEKCHEIWLVIQMIILIFLINCCWLIGKLQIFVKLFVITYQQMLNFKKLNY